MKTKAASEVLDYEESYAADMAASSPADTIVSSTWVVSGGIAIGDLASPEVTDSNTTTTTKVWLNGGTDFTYATATNTVVTAANRTFVRTQVIEVKPIVCE